MTRLITRSFVTYLAALSFALSAVCALGADTPFKELLEISLKNKKGLTFYVNGQVIAGGVIRIGDDVVEVKNREFARITIRLDRIDAIAAN
jgi:hypothetical protein